MSGEITVYPISDLEHNQQVLAGLEMLRDRGHIAFEYRYDGAKRFGIKARSPIDAPMLIVIVDIRELGTVIFDLHDSEALQSDLYEGCFLYFKRSYIPECHALFTRVRSFGLNYEARSPRISGSALVRALMLSKDLKAMLRSVSRDLHLPVPPVMDVPLFSSQRIDFREVPRVLFLAYAWDPYDDPSRPEQYVQQRMTINEMRAKCVRALRAAFGDHFTGGLLRHGYSVKTYPDCVVARHFPTDRRAFLRLADAHQICVATTGLYDSIGWKFTEFVAKGRAVVAEKMRVCVPGPFGEPTNYLTFRTAEECVARCSELVRDPVSRYDMMQANRAYFRGYVAPDAIVRNALDVVAKESAGASNSRAL